MDSDCMCVENDPPIDYSNKCLKLFKILDE